MMWYGIGVLRNIIVVVAIELLRNVKRFSKMNLIDWSLEWSLEITNELIKEWDLEVI